MSLFANVPAWIRENPDHLKTQEMCFEAVRIEPLSLAFVPDHFKTQGMCNEVLLREPYSLLFVPGHLKTQVCNEIIRTMPETLEYVPDHFETQETCDKTTLKRRGYVRRQRGMTLILCSMFLFSCYSTTNRRMV